MKDTLHSYAATAVAQRCSLEVYPALTTTTTVYTQAGTCVMPLSRNSLLRAIRQKVPPLLASSSSFFIPPAMYYDSQVRVWIVLWTTAVCCA
jgi:hypothetical protein